MDVKVEHLFKRGNTYYFRWRVPKEFSEKVPLQEIKCSLKTKELAKAQTSCKILIQELNQILRSNKDVKLSKEQIREIMAGVAKRHMDSHEKHLALFGEICDKSQQEGIAHCDNLILMTREALRKNDLNFHTAYKTAQTSLSDVDHDKISGNYIIKFQYFKPGTYLSPEGLTQGNRISVLQSQHTNPSSSSPKGGYWGLRKKYFSNKIHLSWTTEVQNFTWRE